MVERRLRKTLSRASARALAGGDRQASAIWQLDGEPQLWLQRGCGGWRWFAPDGAATGVGALLDGQRFATRRQALATRQALRALAG